MDEKDTPTRVAKWTAVVLVVSILFASASIGVALFLRQASITDTQRFANELRNGLVKNCDRNGNPLREAVRGMLQEQIKRSNAPEVRRFFPQIPPAELERLIRQQHKADRATIRKIAPVDCQRLYPQR